MNIISMNHYEKKVFNLRAEKLIREAGDSFIYFKDYELALKQVNAVLKIDSGHTKALLLKGDILLCLDNDLEALNYYDKAIESDKECAQAYGSKAGVLDMLGRQKEALECCNKAFEYATAKDKCLMTALYDQKLSILHSLRRFEEAKSVLKNAVKNLPSEDSEYLLSCYYGTIESSYKEKMRKQEIASKMELQLVY